MIKGAINRPVTVSMFLLAVSLFGYISLDRLSLNLLPDISYPTLTIQTEYQDAAPEEVESLITRPIEEAVGVLPGLTRLSSVSRSGPVGSRARVPLGREDGPRQPRSAREARRRPVASRCQAARSFCASILPTIRSCGSGFPART